ncbi:MAG: threonine/serine exporter family protein [Deltaproteobacteria bacterium]|nr:threonine/serine exporter family protein [Deltaproteobacteria bacterium]
MSPSDDALGSTAEREALVLALARELHAAGAPAHRLEDVLGQLARALGLETQLFSTPTALIVAFGPLATQRTRLIRVEPGGLDLGRLDRLDEILRRATSGALAPALALAEVERVCHPAAARPDRLGPVALVITYALLSATSARFFGGGWAEITIGGGVGALVGLFTVVWPRVTTGAPVSELLAAATASFLVAGAAALVPEQPVSAYIATLSALVGLLPGFSLTVAVTELATRHLASGTARATAAAITLLQLAVGVALGERLGAAAFGPAPEIAPAALPPWTEGAALVLSPFVLAALLHAPWRRIGPIFVVCVAGYFGARLGGDWLGRELGASAGAFVVAVLSRLFAAREGSTQLVTLVPAFLLLVPGSFGFKSVSLFLGQDVTSGIDAAIRMMLIAMAIAAGLLVAQAIASRRRTTL